MSPCMEKSQREKWRLRINWVLGAVLAQVLLGVCSTGYLTSFHRFVTNPTKDHLSDKNLTIFPGLGESEFFYSVLLTVYYGSACVATMLIGFLVSFVPYWYLFVSAITLHILGSIIYGVTTQGWHLILSQLCVGYFFGAQFTLGYSYANTSSAVYAEVVAGEKKSMDVDEYKTRLRDYLYSTVALASVFGYFIGPGFSVLVTFLPIDQFRSIAWFNVGCGAVLLLLVILFFRKECTYSSFKESCHATGAGCRSSKTPFIEYFILGTMFLFAVIDSFKWGVPETLENPILSDSFGISLTVSPYFYVGLGIPQLLGVLTLFLLQRLKLSSNVVLLYGMILTTIGFFLLADWQAIPYDPCTEYSPFHHPEIVENQNLSMIGKSRYVNKSISLSPSGNSSSLDFQLHSNIMLHFEDSSLQAFSIPITTSLTCTLDPQCECDHAKISSVSQWQAQCFVVTVKKDSYINMSAQYACSNDAIDSVCLNLNVVNHTSLFNVTEPTEQAEIQELQVLTKAASELASNACMNADVPGRHCHWIPFSLVTKTKCIDCPPICRAKEQTLSFIQFVLALFLLMYSLHITVVPLMAIATDHAPNIKGSEGVVIGCISMTTLLSQALSPLFLDALYEGLQKRTFVGAIILGVLHLPFIVELLVFYKQFATPAKKRQDT